MAPSMVGINLGIGGGPLAIKGAVIRTPATLAYGTVNGGNKSWHWWRTVSGLLPMLPLTSNAGRPSNQQAALLLKSRRGSVTGNI
ncbi:hypothetical protein NDU88_009314 [Pleurodeles waltl]|uniref:Uncharacterized protein n=1 Tax=Pleurodeles waltl TaxID=8319 RepID=A0AAV7PZ41_PLEWA|nr:hypothetical protein NDU88_009314 [Pleurodeles waltl]